MFRLIAATIMGIIGMRVTHHYDDPVFKDSRGIPQRKKKRAHGHHSKGRWSPGRETARKAYVVEPGHIAYHDKLVRHFGRRRADGYGECMQRKMLSALPTKHDFDAAVPWAFLRSTLVLHQDRAARTRPGAGKA